jgi:hypothetical protein
MLVVQTISEPLSGSGVSSLQLDILVIYRAGLYGVWIRI